MLLAAAMSRATMGVTRGWAEVQPMEARVLATDLTFARRWGVGPFRRPVHGTVPDDSRNAGAGGGRFCQAAALFGESSSLYCNLGRRVGGACFVAAEAFTSSCLD